MITLRQAEEKDAPSIRQMVRQARINPTGLKWPRFIVAVSEMGQIIGCVQVKTHPDGTRELASLVVLPAWQGTGIARSLIEQVLAANPGTLYLMCRSGLVPFYSRFCFKDLPPREMPPDYLRLYNLFGILKQFRRSSEHLAIMRRGD